MDKFTRLNLNGEVKWVSAIYDGSGNEIDATYETIETTPIFVIKANGARQAFDPNKIRTGIIKACEKRPVPAPVIDKVVDDIQKKIYNSLAQEVSSKAIGEMICEQLKDIDEVAYVRFASVYRSFTDTTSFIKELEKMVKKDK